MWRGGSRLGLSVAAPFVWRCPSNLAVTPFPHPLIEPDVQIARIRLSDKTSRLHPRHVVPKPGQAYETEVPVEVRERISPAPASPDLVLVAQPPAQPRSRVDVERSISAMDAAYLKVVRPAAPRAAPDTHQLRGPLPRHRDCCHRMDLLDHAPDALLRRLHAQSSLAGRPRIHPPK